MSDKDLQTLPLAGYGVVVTRPEAQAGSLCKAIEACGGEAFRFPVLKVQPLAHADALRGLAAQLKAYDIVFFVSTNAVRYAMDVLPKAYAWPAHTKIACIGPSSEESLRQSGFKDIVVPKVRNDSEALLALPQFQSDAMRGKRVAILRGNGGRELVADSLCQRGAVVDVFVCYQRIRAQIDPRPLIQAYAADRVHALTLTSSESVLHFVTLLGFEGARMWRDLPVFVTHARIADAARQAGASNIQLTEPGDEGLIDDSISGVTMPRLA